MQGHSTGSLWGRKGAAQAPAWSACNKLGLVGKPMKQRCCKWALDTVLLGGNNSSEARHSAPTWRTGSQSTA